MSMRIFTRSLALRAQGLLVYPHEIRAEKEQIYGTRYKKDEVPATKQGDSGVPMRLLQDVHGVGRAGEVVEVRKKSAKNHFFSQGLAAYLNYAERQEYELMRMDLANWVSDRDTAYSLTDAANGRYGVPSIGATLRRARENVLREEAIATGLDEGTAADLALAVRASARTVTKRELHATSASPFRRKGGSEAEEKRMAATDPLGGKGAAGGGNLDPARAAEIAAKKAAGLKQRMASITQKRQASSNARVGKPPPSL